MPKKKSEDKNNEEETKKPTSKSKEEQATQESTLDINKESVKSQTPDNNKSKKEPSNQSEASDINKEPIKHQTSDNKSKSSKFEELKKKALALEKKVEEAKPIDIKKEVKEEKEEKKDTLVPIEDYLKASIHLGTRVITPDMRPYVYRRRADGLAVFNTALLDDKLREGAEYLIKFSPEQVLFVCKREAGWKAAEKFAEITGIKTFTKKYPAGILTNTNLENFIEKDLIFICDPWLDKNALADALKIKIPVLAICDTNNFTQGITQVIPGNNKSYKSLGMILFLLAKLYIEKKKLKVSEPKIQDFVTEWDALQPPQ